MFLFTSARYRLIFVCFVFALNVVPLTSTNGNVHALLQQLKNEKQKKNDVLEFPFGFKFDTQFFHEDKKKIIAKLPRNKVEIQFHLLIIISFRS